MKQLKMLLLSSIVMLFTACGSKDESRTDVYSGSFYSGSVVAGLNYKTDTMSGVTNATGTFNYKEGETITFSIGNFVIGETVVAKSRLTPADLIPDAVLYTTNTEVLNMLRSNVVNIQNPTLLESTPTKKRSFNKLHNILTFIEALDDDSDPNNGINIPEGIDSLLNGVTIDFEQDFSLFEDNKKLCNLTHKATNLGLLNSAFIPKYGVALEHFYQGEDINYTFSIVGSTTDLRNLSTTTYTYDSNGNLLSDYFNTYTYDANQNLLTTYGELYNYILINNYDDNGNLLTKSVDQEVPDGEHNCDSYIITYTYDANGNLLTEKLDCDVYGDYMRTYTYDSNDNLLTYGFTTYGRDDILSTDSYTTYTYDAEGNRLTAVYDENRDDIPEEIRIYTYDSDGNILTESYDEGVDGILNTIITYTYDTIGNMLTESYDEGADGTLDTIITYTYDTEGNRLTAVKSDDIFNSIYTYTYNSTGNLLSESYDEGADGTLDRINTYTYDAIGNLLIKSYDDDADGTLDKIFTYTYYTDGFKLTSCVDYDADGICNFNYQYTPVHTTWRGLLSRELGLLFSFM